MIRNLWLGLGVICFLFSSTAHADKPKTKKAVPTAFGSKLPAPTVQTPPGTQPGASVWGAKLRTPVSTDMRGKSEPYPRRLASGNKEGDLSHYKNLKRRLGVDIGFFVPFGDFVKDFSNAPSIGLHFIWEAIPPFAFTVGMMRAASSYKNAPASGKLSVTSISIGTQASFPVSRFVPFIKMNGEFYFNDVSFDSGKVVTAGYDALLTSVGVSAGLGFDFVVGREVSLGVDALYHYPVPKKIQTSAGDFDIASPFATVNFRVNF